VITADVVDGAMICLDPSRASFPEPTGVGGTRALAVPQNRSRDAVTQRETIALSNNLWSASFVKLGTPLIGSFPQFVLPVAVVAGIVAAVAVIYAKTAGDDQGPEFALRGEVGGPAGLVLYVVNGGQFDLDALDFTIVQNGDDAQLLYGFSHSGPGPALQGSWGPLGKGGILTTACYRHSGEGGTVGLQLDARSGERSWTRVESLDIPPN